MAEALHLPPEDEESTATEQIRLGDQTLELDPQSARIVRDAFESLAGQYSEALENFRRQQLQTIGTPQQPPTYPTPMARTGYLPDGSPLLAPGVEVPDPDLLFQNKGAWTENFQQSLESRLGQLEGRQTQLVQGAVTAFQQELARRDAAQAAQAKHDAAMAEMLERRGLTENTLVVQAVYNENYDKLKHLPLEIGLDRIGALAQEEIQKIRSGEKWTMVPAQTQAGVTQRPPAMLRSSRRVQRAPAPAASEGPQLESPGGGLGQMGMIIRKRQQALLNSKTA